MKREVGRGEGEKRETAEDEKCRGTLCTDLSKLCLFPTLSFSLYHTHKHIHTHTHTRVHTHTSKEKADQIFICLSGLKLWLGPFTAAGSLLMMRGSCSPRERGNTNKKTHRLIDTNEQAHTRRTCKYTRTHTRAGFKPYLLILRSRFLRF